MNRFAAAPLTLIVLVLGLAACGGDDGDAPSKADFAASADKICKNAETALQNVGENAKSPDEVAAAVDKVIDETQKSIDQLQDLGTPDLFEPDRAHQPIVLLKKSSERRPAVSASPW